jgi:sn-glycerol 3-phosphate transport system substrate-binding protein
MDSDTRTVNVWLNDYPFPGFLDPVREAARTFNAAHPGHEVVIHGHDFRTMPSKVARAVEQGEPPDVAEYLYTSTQQALDTLGADGTRLYTPIGRALGDRTEVLGEPVLVDDVVPAARDYFRIGGQQWALPPTASTVVLFANTDLLRAAGIDELPRTWRELETACRAVTALPGGPACGVAWPNHVWFLLQAVAQQGGLIADRDNGRSGRAEKIDLASAEVLAWVTWWSRLQRDGLYRYSGKRSDWNSCFEAFGSGQAAFLLSSSVDAARLIAQGRENGRTVRAGRMPYNDEAAFAGNMIGGDGLWLRAGLDEATSDTALAFMQHMVKPDKAAQWHRQNNRLPITRSSVALLDEQGWFRENPDLRVATEQLDAADGSPAALGPLLGDFAGIQKEITQAMHDVLAEGADPGARFAAATTRAQELLDAYNTSCAGPPRRTPANLKVAW